MNVVCQSWNQPSPVAFLEWDPVDSGVLTVLLADGLLNRYYLGTRVHHSHGKEADDLTNVAVVDGNVVKITPFRQMVVPPPISAYELHFPHPIDGLDFSSRGNKLIVLCGGTFHICTTDGHGIRFFNSLFVV